MKLQRLGLLFAFFLLFSTGRAQKATVGIRLNFDVTNPNQKTEIEILKKGQSSPLLSQIFIGAQFRTELPPDTYSFRTRALDQRGLPGSWSEAVEFAVKPKKVEVRNEADASPVHADEKTGQGVARLRWTPVDGARKYKLILRGKDGKFQRTEVVSSPAFEAPLPPGDYLWSVAGVAVSGLESDESPPAQIRVLGPRIPPLEFKKASGQKIVFEPRGVSSTEAISIVYELKHRRIGDSDWRVREKGKSQSGLSINFNPPLEAGEYEIKYSIEADHWEPSLEMTRQFIVKPAAEVLLPKHL